MLDVWQGSAQEFAFTAQEMETSYLVRFTEEILNENIPFCTKFV